MVWLSPAPPQPSQKHHSHSKAQANEVVSESRFLSHSWLYLAVSSQGRGVKDRSVSPIPSTKAPSS